MITKKKDASYIETGIIKNRFYTRTVNAILKRIACLDIDVDSCITETEKIHIRIDGEMKSNDHNDDTKENNSNDKII